MEQLPRDWGDITDSISEARISALRIGENLTMKPAL